MFCYNELPYGIISPNCFLNIETINITSSYDNYYYDNIDDADYDKYIHNLEVEILNCEKIIRNNISSLIN